MSEHDQPTQGGAPRQPVAGLDLIESALEEESFPMAKDGLYYAIGDYLLQDASGEHIAVRDLLEHVGRDHFGSAGEALEQLRQALLDACRGKGD